MARGRLIRIGWMAALAILVGGRAAPADPLPVRVAVFDNLPLIGMANGVPTGADMEHLTRLFARLRERAGIEARIEAVECPFARCLALLEEGGVDLVSGVKRTPERERGFLFLEPPLDPCPDLVFYVRSGAEEAIGTYSDLYGRTIGTRKGVLYFTPFDRDPRLTKDPMSTMLPSLRKLAAGRIDAVVGSELPTDFLVAQSGLGRLVAKARYRVPPAAGDQRYIALSRRSRLAAWAEDLGRRD